MLLLARNLSVNNIYKVEEIPKEQLKTLHFSFVSPMRSHLDYKAQF